MPRGNARRDWDKVAVGIYNDGPRALAEFYRVPRKLDTPHRDLSRRPLSCGIPSRLGPFTVTIRRCYIDKMDYAMVF